MNLLRRLTTPPRFEDEAEARSANLLSSILRLLFVVMGLFFVLSLILNTGQGYGYYVIFLLVIGITYALIRQGQVQRATYFFATMIWLGSTVVGLAFNRVDSTGRVAFMLAILICGAILKGRSQVIAFLAVFASALGTYFLNRLDLISSLPPPLNMNPDINQFLILAFAAFVLYLVARILGEAIYRARSNEEATRAILDDLVHTSISQSYLNNILRSLTDTLIVLDPAHKIERVNQASLDLLGYSEADLIGQPLSKILSSHALERLAGSSDKALTSVETAYLAHDGREIPVSFSSSLLYDDDGSPQGIVCVAQDISERKAAADQLRQREELYRTLAGNLPGMDVILFDEDMMVMLAEGHTLYEDGYDSTAKGQSLSNLLAGVADGHIEDVCRTALIGSHIQMESVYKDLTLYLEALPVKNESGETFAGLLLLYDITRIKKTENELKQRIEQLTTVRQLDDELSRNLSVDYVLDLVLDIAIRVSGARSAAVVLYADDFKVARSYGDELGESIKPELRQVMREGVGLNLGARMIVPLISLQRPLGAVVMLSKREFSEVAFNFMQILASRIAVALDNAQLFQMTQDQLAESRQLYERVSELEQLKSDMIRIAAHDLRNPLNIISGFSELLLDSEDIPGHERDQIEHIFRASGRMQTLVADILSLDRIERLQEGGYDRLNFAELVQQVFETFEVKAEHKTYSLELPDHPVEVQGDAPQLREAVSNFIGNALKYTPDGGSVTVRLSVEGEEAIFEVVDTGYGIPAEVQSRLFEPFFRVKEKETRNIEGTGLGLHLVKNIIERHNGTVFAHSVHGVGSTFGFRLHLDTASQDDQSELVTT